MNILHISKDTLINNIKIIRQIANGAKLCLPVKANAYGHGIEPIVSITSDWVDYYAAANIEEAIRVRNISTKPVLVFGVVDYQYIQEIFDNNLSVTLQEFEDIIKLESQAKSYNKKLKVHINVNTGMNRMGIDYIDAKKTISKALSSEFIELEGVYSHLACADNKDHPGNKKQIERFKELVDYIRLKNKDIICHLANSYGLLGQEGISYDMVRTGILTYGYLPHFYVERIARDIKPIARLTSKVVKIIRLDKNEGVGYSLLYRGYHNEIIATLPLGYGDGYPRELGGRGSVNIDGKIYPIVGQISMDALAISLGRNQFNVKIGDDVEIFSDIPRERNSVFSVAQLTNTIEYDIVTTLTQRVVRKKNYDILSLLFGA